MTDDKEQRQQVHKLPKPVGRGKDDHGEYETINLSMVRGGKTKPFTVYVDPIRHILNNSAPAPRGWYKDKTPESDRIRPRPCYTEAMLTTPYGGYCFVGCAHCYINNGTRGYRATGLPTVNPGYPAAMRNRIDNIRVTGAGYITSFSEPFHRLEERYHITQDLTQVFVDNGLPFFYLSRRIPPKWATDALLHNPYSYMQWSINTSNGDHWRKLSPGAPDLDDMLMAVNRVASDLGIFVSIQCNPVIAGVTTLDDLVELIIILSDAGAHHIIFKFVEQVANNRQVVVDRMRERKLPHVDTFDNLFNQVIGGVYTIQEDVRIEWLDVLLDATRRYGLTMGLCYEYYDDGKAGANLAPWYTTADQCHGRGVPLYVRPNTNEPFQPLPGCYRKGCLYCREHGTQACCNDRLLEAPALTYKDLRDIDIDVTECESDWDLPDSCLPPERADEHLNEIIGNPGLATDAELWGWEHPYELQE